MPVVILADTELVPVSRTDTLLLPALTTYARVPSGVTATLTGKLPTLTVATTVSGAAATAMGAIATPATKATSEVAVIKTLRTAASSGWNVQPVVRT